MTFALALALTLHAGAPDVEVEIERGNALIRNLQEEQALALLEPLARARSTPPQLRARACVYAGIARLNVGEEAAARRWFEEAVALDPGASLPAWASRRVTATFEAVRAKAQPSTAPPPASAPAPAPAPALTPVPDPALAPAAAAAAAPEVVQPAPSRKLPLVLGVGAAALAIASVVLFVLWSDVYHRAANQPVSLEAQRLQQQSGVFWVLGFSTAALASALGVVSVVSAR